MSIMKNKFFIYLICCYGLSIIGCTKDYAVPENRTTSKQGFALSKSNGVTQISGISFFAEQAECNHIIQGATYALKLTGDLVGCWYVFVEEFNCSPSGTYRERGREYFVGTYNGIAGTFRTGYKFEAKFEGCAPDGSYLGAEIFGRCQHPIVRGSGTGVFEGVTGRLDFKDDIAAGNFPYRGHLGL